MSATPDSKNPFLAQFDELDRWGPTRSWKLVLREAGRQRSSDAQAFPTAKTEDWRFTSVAPLLRERFALQLALQPTELDSLLRLPAAGLLHPKAILA